MTKLIKTLCKTGEWPKDFTELTMVAVKKKPQVRKCGNHYTISLIAHTAKIIGKVSVRLRSHSSVSAR